MDTGKVNLWEMIEKNPSEGYKEYFSEEENFLKENLSKNDLVLDIGCGNGRTMKLIYKFCKKVYGIDYNEKAINDCKNNLEGINNVQVFLEDARKTHFENEFFDVVFIGLTFSNFSDELIRNILTEIKRILKDSGKFIFSCYNENSFEERWGLYQEHVPNEVEIVDKEKGFVKSKTGEEISRNFSEKDIKEILVEGNFEIEDIKKGKIFYLIKAWKNLN